MGLRLRLIPMLALALVVGLRGLVGIGSGNAGRDVRRITIVNVSDWHGQLEPFGVRIDGKTRQVGGAPVLKYYFDQERKRNPGGTLVVTAGDAFGATPPLSSFFEDVPAVEALNAIGFDIDTLGNHNFDHGLDRLRKLMGLAQFPYVAANIVGPDGRTLAPPYRLFTKNGIRVGVIGIGNPATPALVFPGRIGNYKFRDPVPVVNKYAEELRARGAHIVVVLAHIGADAVSPDGVPVGPLGDAVKAVRGVDVFIGDHTGVAVNTIVNNTLVVENRSQGVQYAVIELEYDMNAQALVAKSATQKWPFVDGASPDTAVQAILDKYKARVQPLLDKKVGETARVLNRASERESLLGNLATDMMRERYHTQLAFYNSGGFRAEIPSYYQPANTQMRRSAPGYASGPPYDIVAGDVFTALPFGDVAVTFTITGKTLWDALEHSVSRVIVVGGAYANTDGRFLQVSGFTYRFDPRNPAGQRVVSVTWANGKPIPRDHTVYTAVTGNFVYSGGDGYAMLNNGSGTTRELIADTISHAMRQMGTIKARTEGRISPVQTSTGAASPSFGR